MPGKKKKSTKKIEYSPQIAKTIRNLKEQGKKNREVAEILGISERLLYKWKEKYSEVAEALSIKHKRDDGYKKEYAEKVKYMKLLGYTVEKICEELGIVPQTYYNWAKKYEEFASAAQIDVTSENLKVTEALLKSITGHVVQEERIEYEFVDIGNGKFIEVPRRRIVTRKEVPPQTNALMKWLINRDPKHWKDRVDISIEEQEEQVDPQEIELDSKLKELGLDVVNWARLWDELPDNLKLQWIETGDVDIIKNYLKESEKIYILEETNEGDS